MKKLVIDHKSLSFCLMSILAALCSILMDAFFFNKIIPEIYVEATTTASLVVWNGALAVTAFILSMHSKEKMKQKSRLA